MTPSKPYLPLSIARDAAVEATRLATESRVRIIVAVVDEGGKLVLLERMDNAAYGKLEKAISAAQNAVARHESPTSAPGREACASLLMAM